MFSLAKAAWTRTLLVFVSSFWYRSTHSAFQASSLTHAEYVSISMRPLGKHQFWGGVEEKNNKITANNWIDYFEEILARVEMDPKVSVTVRTFEVGIVVFNAWDTWSMGIFRIPLRRESASSQVDLYFSRERAGWAPGAPGCARGGRAPSPAISRLRRSIAKKSALFSKNCY